MRSLGGASPKEKFLAIRPNRNASILIFSLRCPEFPILAILRGFGVGHVRFGTSGSFTVVCSALCFVGSIGLGVLPRILKFPKSCCHCSLHIALVRAHCFLWLQVLCIDLHSLWLQFGTQLSLLFVFDFPIVVFVGCVFCKIRVYVFCVALKRRTPSAFVMTPFPRRVLATSFVEDGLPVGFLSPFLDPDS